MTKLLCTVLGLFISSMASSQVNRLNEYLNALMTKESIKSKETITRNSFNLTHEYSLLSFGNPTGEYFKTDISGVKGYKATVFCTAKDAEQNVILDTFMVVMYYDHTKSLWKVFDFRTLAEPCYEASVSQEEIDNGKFYTDKEYVYRNLGYWYMMCGKIGQAESAYHSALVEAEAKGMAGFVTEHMQTIQSIR